MASQQTNKQVNVQQILLFHETRLKNVDEILKDLIKFKDSQNKGESLKEQRDSNTVKTMAMNQNNFNKTLHEFSERVSKVEQLLIDIKFETKALKETNSVVVSALQENKPKEEVIETDKEVSLTVTEKEEVIETDKEVSLTVTEKEEVSKK